ncbi:hypothetical protein [Magnetococcus marinus]|uniref:hypothetical protein n=1 Tax=Magnetococcus marinus TaxID=1124597 RepID=UPI0005A29D02|nr:hypothetical protein [Magnetococcus marinus]
MDADIWVFIRAIYPTDPTPRFVFQPANDEKGLLAIRSGLFLQAGHGIKSINQRFADLPCLIDLHTRLMVSVKLSPLRGSKQK